MPDPNRSVPLFGLAFSPLQVSAFGNLVLTPFEYDGSEQYTAFM